MLLCLYICFYKAHYYKSLEITGLLKYKQNSLVNETKRFIELMNSKEEWWSDKSRALIRAENEMKGIYENQSEWCWRICRPLPPLTCSPITKEVYSIFTGLYWVLQMGRNSVESNTYWNNLCIKYKLQSEESSTWTIKLNNAI